MTEAEVLEAAADYIEEHGWCQNSWRTTDGRVCLEGAVRAIEPRTWEGFDRDPLLVMWDYLEEVPYIWNDAEHRTKEQVVKELRACAADLRERTDV